MITIKDLIYALTCLSFSIIVGAAVYEHLAVWPRAYAAPPLSLSMFQGEYGLNSGAFWTKIHPVTLLLFITTLILFWKSARRKTILIVFIGYIVVMVTTFLYFVPELIDITTTEYTTAIDESLRSRGALWEKLSLLRLAVITGLAIVLYFGASKTEGVNN